MIDLLHPEFNKSRLHLQTAAGYIVENIMTIYLIPFPAKIFAGFPAKLSLL
jgi:hypothetical protein